MHATPASPSRLSAARAALTTAALALLTACGADGPGQELQDTTASVEDATANVEDTVAPAGACDAVAIPCCDREGPLATCAPASGSDPERWLCGAAEVGTAAYGTACRDANPASCPAEPVASADPGGAGCALTAEGDVCWYLGLHGFDGVEWREVCTCVSEHWSCEASEVGLSTCLEPRADVVIADRRAPAERDLAPAGACLDPADEPRDATCVPSQDDSGSTCASNAACAADAVCLDVHSFGPSSGCACRTAACLTHDDCQTGELCQCGAVTSRGRCDGWGGLPCANRCVPAGCRSDADCGPGGRCTASRDVCGWQVERYACHYPDRAECWTDDECGSGGLCRFDAGTAAWCCQSKPVCE